jgi:hypothetical protein
MNVTAEISEALIHVTRAFTAIAADKCFSIIVDRGLITEAIDDDETLLSMLQERSVKELLNVLDGMNHVAEGGHAQFEAMLWLLVSTRAAQLGAEVAEDWIALQKGRA